MSDSTRRGFLKVAGVGAAAAGAAAVIPATANAATPDKSLTLPQGAEPSMVVYVEDVHSGKVALMVEGHEYTVVDHQLVARLAHAMHAAKSA